MYEITLEHSRAGPARGLVCSQMVAAPRAHIYAIVSGHAVQELTPNDCVVWEVPADVPFGKLPTYIKVFLFR